jgi:hypothetical protein
MEKLKVPGSAALFPQGVTSTAPSDADDTSAL